MTDTITDQRAAGPSVHRIVRLKSAGKYCEIWLDTSPKDRGTSFHVAPKWDELHKLVEEAGLEDHILNHGYRGLRAIITPDTYGNLDVVALSTSPSTSSDLEDDDS